nr:immunoglobulin light chain junction region [Macaca mulatta]MOV64163.1 immunoglobulin light chain junction region [Macaca mulatta]
CQQHNCYPPTF